MYKDPNNSSGSGASTKGDEVELVSRFLAPLCARDETARNIALAVARNTVEGWLGGVGSPNQWEDSAEIENANDETGRFKGQDGRYDMSVERSPRKAVPRQSGQRDDEAMQHNYQAGHQVIQEAFRIEGFFPQSVTDNPFIRDGSAERSERFPSGSFDCLDGRLGNDPSGLATPQERWHRKPVLHENLVEKLANSVSSDEAKGFVIDEPRALGRRFKDSGIIEPRFSSSSESERIFFDYGASTSEMPDESYTTDEARQRLGKNFGKIKGARQKQLEDDDLDSDTRIYGKSPKFDENHGNFGPYEASKIGNYLSRSEQYGKRVDRDGERYDRRNFNIRGRRFYEYSDGTSYEEDNSPRTMRNRDGVVFNTLEGFENDNTIAACENDGDDDELRNTEERKFSVGQIKRPLSQDEDVSSKSGRVLEGAEVTPGDVGRMLNLGNALDGPRQAQANKYLSLVTLHLPVILRLSVNCPFQNVRIKCAEILMMVKDRGLPVPESAFDGPSAFVPISEVTGRYTSDEYPGMRCECVEQFVDSETIVDKVSTGD